MKKLNKKVRRMFEDQTPGKYSVLISFTFLVVLLLVMYCIKPAFLNGTNIKNLLTDVSPLLILTAGITFVLRLGSIDLSIGSISSLSAVMFAMLIGRVGWITYLIVFAFGILAGAINGFFHAKVRIPSFIVTLATMSFWQSIAYIISGGSPQQIYKESWYLINWVKQKAGVVPFIFLFALFVLVVLCIIQEWRKIGRYISAVGYNERTAVVAGVGVVRAKVIAFTICGACAALGGILFAAKSKTGNVSVGDAYTMYAIVAAVLGGASLSGGRGRVIGALSGAAIVIAMQNGMNILAINSYWQNILFGAIVLCSMILGSRTNDKRMVVK